MLWLIAVIVGVAVAFIWLIIWAYVLRMIFRVSLLQRKPEDRESRRERMKELGKLRYILLFGLLGYGFGFALALTTADLLTNRSLGIEVQAGKLLFLTVVFGWFQGARSWSEAFRDPTPFPPRYTVTK
jgi:hypothetical protein